MLVCEKCMQALMLVCEVCVFVFVCVCVCVCVQGGSTSIGTSVCKQCHAHMHVHLHVTEGCARCARHQGHARHGLSTCSMCVHAQACVLLRKQAVVKQSLPSVCRACLALFGTRTWSLRWSRMTPRARWVGVQSCGGCA